MQLETGLRERKKAEAREALVLAALSLFRERGFDQVTVEEIAAQANVSRRTFFRYFSTKEAVVIERRREQLELLRQALAAQPASVSLQEGLAAALEQLARDYDQHRARILEERALFDRAPTLAIADLQLDRSIEEIVAAFSEKRLGRGTKERRRARMFAASLVAMLRVAINEWADARGKNSLRELGTEALTRALQALA